MTVLSSQPAYINADTPTSGGLLAAAELPGPLSRASEDDVSECVQRVLMGAAVVRRGGERRQEQRYPYPYLVQLTPVAADGRLLSDQTICVVGKHLSEHGFDFYHREPIAHRRMVATLQARDGSKVSLLLDLTWCRFNSYGWYDNGGRFLKAAG